MKEASYKSRRNKEINRNSMIQLYIFQFIYIWVKQRAQGPEHSFERIMN